VIPIPSFVFTTLRAKRRGNRKIIPARSACDVTDVTDFTLNTKKANGKSPPQKPGEFWRTQGEDADQVAELLTAEEIARAVDALNFTLVAFGVPDKFRAYIDGLIGVSGGCLDWFEAADIEIAQRAREVTSRGLKEKSLEKWTQRNREEFAD